MSLLTIGAVTMPFCFFSLGQLVSWLIQVQILLQFIWQCAAVILLRRYRPDIPKPFRMWLYPLPALVSLGDVALHLRLGAAAGIVFSVAFLAVAVAAYFIFGETRANALVRGSRPRKPSDVRASLRGHGRETARSLVACEHARLPALERATKKRPPLSRKRP